MYMVILILAQKQIHTDSRNQLVEAPHIGPYHGFVMSDINSQT